MSIIISELELSILQLIHNNKTVVENKVVFEKILIFVGSVEASLLFLRTVFGKETFRITNFYQLMKNISYQQQNEY
ncbi:hypothetical protein [Bacillus sp. FSL R5-0659]|uniref:hypothetical protein n=1 Tax=Bacillus sp. FSL R5-0659 TaxID=2954590 RepID=UPI0030F78C32